VTPQACRLLGEVGLLRHDRHFLGKPLLVHHGPGQAGYSAAAFSRFPYSWTTRIGCGADSVGLFPGRSPGAANISVLSAASSCARIRSPPQCLADAVDQHPTSAREARSPGPCPNQQGGSLPASRAACRKSNIPASELFAQISDRLEYARATGRFRLYPGLRGLDGDGHIDPAPATQSATTCCTSPSMAEILAREAGTCRSRKG